MCSTILQRPKFEQASGEWKYPIQVAATSQHTDAPQMAQILLAEGIRLRELKGASVIAQGKSEQQPCTSPPASWAIVPWHESSPSGSRPILYTVKFMTTSKQQKTQNNTHKDQHFVPNTYLKAWLDPQSLNQAKLTPYVWFYNRHTGAWKSKSPAKFFTENNIYTQEGTGGERDLTIENWLGTIEDQFANVRKNKIEKRLPLDLNDKVLLAVFAATLYARTPAYREMNKAMLSPALAMAKKMKAAYDELPPEKKEEWGNKSRTPSPISTASEGISIDRLEELIEKPFGLTIQTAAQEMAKILMNMQFVFLIAPDDEFFISSDHPVGRFNTQTVIGDLRDGSAILSLPITPKICLMLDWVTQEKYIDVDCANVQAINQLTALNSNTHLVSHQRGLPPKTLSLLPPPATASSAAPI